MKPETPEGMSPVSETTVERHREYPLPPPEAIDYLKANPNTRHFTYETAAEAEADRAQQKRLLVALGAWDRALRRDECGAWTISGEHGTIHTWGDGKTWVFYVACRSDYHWTHTKKRLGFCELRLDCDGEGTLRLHQLPTPEQAEVIRDILGIRKRMEFTTEDLERRRASMARLANAKKPASRPPPIG